MSEEGVPTEIKVSTIVTILADHLQKRENGKEYGMNMYFPDVPLEVQKIGRDLDSWPRGKILVHQSTSASLVCRKYISI